MIIIDTISSEYFSFNGINFAKIYQPLQQGLEQVGIYNIFDTRQQLQNSTDFDEYEIDGVVYGTQALTIAALLPVIFTSPIDSSDFNITNIAVVAAWSFVVPKEYLLSHIRISNGVGAASDCVVNISAIAALGDDIIDDDMGQILLSRAGRPLVFGINDHYSLTGDTTIYITVTGANPVLNISAKLVLDV